jgi:hypothetical protein
MPAGPRTSLLELSGEPEQAGLASDDVRADGEVLPVPVQGGRYGRVAGHIRERREGNEIPEACQIALRIGSVKLGQVCFPDDYEPRTLVALDELGVVRPRVALAEPAVSFNHCKALFSES